MRTVRRGEAAYLELMREAKAQFDAEIARNKEKGRTGRPRKEVAPAVVADDDIEIDFSDVMPVAEEVEEVVVPPPKPAPATKKKEASVKGGKAGRGRKSSNARVGGKATARNSARKGSAAKKGTAAKKGAKKTTKRGTR